MISIFSDNFIAALNKGMIYEDYSSKYIILQIFTLSLSVFMSLLVSLYIAKYIAKPLVKLEKGMKAIEKNDLKVKLKVDQKDELGNVFAGFNKMTRGLKNAYDKLGDLNKTLEKKVEVRTAELLKTKNEIEAINLISQQVNMSLDLEVIFDRIFKFIKKTFHFDGCYISLVSDDKKSYKIELLRFPGYLIEEQRSFGGTSYPISEKGGRVAFCISENTVYYASNVKQNSIENEFNRNFATKLDLKTVIHIPMFVNDEVIGVFSLTSHQKNINLNDNDKKLIRSFVNQICSVIKNSKLYNELKEKKEELEKKSHIM